MRLRLVLPQDPTSIRIGRNGSGERVAANAQIQRAIGENDFVDAIGAFDRSQDLAGSRVQNGCRSSVSIGRKNTITVRHQGPLNGGRRASQYKCSGMLDAPILQRTFPQQDTAKSVTRDQGPFFRENGMATQCRVPRSWGKGILLRVGCWLVSDDTGYAFVKDIEIPTAGGDHGCKARDLFVAARPERWRLPSEPTRRSDNGILRHRVVIRPMHMMRPFINVVRPRLYFPLPTTACSRHHNATGRKHSHDLGAGDR